MMEEQANVTKLGPLDHLVAFWEKCRSSIVVAARSLWLHKTRTVLSMLGIVIGTTAVITLMAFGKGSMQEALDRIKGTATNIHIRSIKPPDKANDQRRSFFVRYGLTESDYEQLKTIPTVVMHVPMRIFTQEIRYANRMVLGRVVGTTEDYQRVNHIEMALGRFLNDAQDIKDEGDNSRFRNVAVLGAAVAAELFPFESPIGKSIVIRQNNYVVVGVVKNRMPVGSAGGKAPEDFNRDVYIPLPTCMARFGEKVYLRQSGSRSGEIVELHQITLKVREMDEVIPTARVVKRILMRNPDHVRKEDVMVTYPLDRLKEAEATAESFARLLLAIASISLVVGGIGIMNIMLATVTERTREIGVRRALGAKRRDIILQFMIEALLQTVAGGVLGVAIGLAVVFLAPIISEGEWPAVLHQASIPISLGFSILVGLVFGLYPAYRASRLDPIEALRHE